MNEKAGGSLFIIFPQLLIQHSFGYTPHMVATFAVRSLRICPAVKIRARKTEIQKSFGNNIFVSKKNILFGILERLSRICLR